jgi:FkbM family methyltransferase
MPSWGANIEVLLSGIYHRIVNNGDTVVDGGANGGMHAIPLARLVGPKGRLYAYEPQARPFAGLAEWLDAEGLRGVATLRRVAIGSKAGAVRFYKNKRDPAFASLRIMNSDEAEWEPIEVPVVRLDDERIRPRCAFIKLDLEGGEYDALVGARRLIERDRPVIAMETAFQWAAEKFGYDTASLFDFFAGLNYELRDFTNIPVTPENYSIDQVTWEMAAIPRESPLLPIVSDTIDEFIRNHEKVAEPRDWGAVVGQVNDPFATGCWRQARPAR